MTHFEIREKFLKFFESKGHKIVPSSSLLPTDPSVLFTTAGMQQFKPYYTGEADPMKDFGSLNTVSIQKSMRTSDIDEIGDDTHLTFFEMLGNFSFGGYWKEEAIQWAYEFITKELDLKISYVTVFKGSDVVPKDEESKKIWQSLGIDDVREEGMEDVFWGPTGNQGPCGPTTEIYCKNQHGQDVEIWNIVFNEFFCDGSRENLLVGKANLSPLTKKGIDTGMGLERLAMIVQKKNNIFETDLFEPIISSLPQNLSNERDQRIISDHARASVFLISDGVIPSNKEQGYVLRKLLRRLIVHLAATDKFDYSVFKTIIKNYKNFYPNLIEEKIINVVEEEYSKFSKTVKNGLKELDKLALIDSVSAFNLFQSYGLPFELIKDLAPDKSKNLTREDFDLEFKKHQEKSRAGVEKKFGGHGLILDTGELKAGSDEELLKITRLHTATHLMNQALHDVLGEGIKQAGSDITTERTRFDFTFDHKVTPEEIKKIEDEVNEKIKEDLPVRMSEVPKEEATKGGARSFRPEKYPDIVKVYYVGSDSDWRKAYSKEFCGGPHVTHTGEIGHFKIIKEESASAGIRRIRAIVE